MRKAGAFLLFLLLVTSILLYAQEEAPDEDPWYDDDFDIYSPDLYLPGDQAFIISLGTVFPAFFVDKFDPPVGGTGSLSYSYFFNAHFNVGGEVGGLFIPTLGRNTLFIIPLGIKAGYQFIFKRIEFPLNITLGMSWHRYLNLAYYGLYMKGGGGAYFRYNADWSFGFTSNLCWFPEWTDDNKDVYKDVHGIMVDFMLSVRYHF
ncbi:MAG: hypothetical protein LBH44_11880 [Treponema sp.]|jgi:hypothetical protein|nr:hypothetical protein [Treponema sp.]